MGPPWAAPPVHAVFVEDESCATPLTNRYYARATKRPGAWHVRTLCWKSRGIGGASPMERYPQRRVC